MKQLLKTLTESFGPSGYEDAIRKIVVTEVKPLADEVRVDALGNVIALNLRPTTVYLSVSSSAISIKTVLCVSPTSAGHLADIRLGRASAF